MQLKFYRMNVVLNESNTAMLLENSERKIEFANKAFCDLFNIKADPNDLIGVDCSQAAELNKTLFIDEQKFVDNIYQLLSNKVKVVDEVLIMKDNTVLHRDYIPIFKDDEYIGHMWSYKIITEMYLLNQKIEQQKMFYEDILNSLPVDVAIFNDKHQYLFVNKKAVPNKETREWIIGKDDFDYVREKNRPLKDAQFRRNLFINAVNNSNAEEIDFQESYPSKNGERQYILRKMKPVFNEDATLKVVVGCGVDITKRVEYEVQLKQSEQKYKDLVNNLQDIIFNLDLEGNFTFLNPAWENITGYKTEDCLGENYSDYFFEIDHNKTKITFKDLLKISNSFKEKEYELTTTSGVKVLSVYLEAIHADSEIEGYRGTASDITDRKKVEEQFKIAMQREKELNDLKSKFVGMVSHEFRTPLATISSSVELIKLISENSDKILSDKIINHTNRVNEQIKRMTELMNEVLLISKIESGGVSATFEVNDLILIVRDVMHEHTFSDFTINLNVNKEKILMNIDQNMIHHVLSNLVSNAVKYSNNKKVVDINVELTDVEVSIEVKDYGIGIPKKEQVKLFTSFFRASNISNIPGTGLGLVVVKYFLDLHNGTIQVNSIENSGSSFLISIPTNL
jgi:PAS domain S-box-containing protein